MSLLAYSNNKQPKEQKVYGVPSAFSILKNKKNFKNVVKTTDFPNHIYYTNDTVKNMRSRKGE